MNKSVSSEGLLTISEAAQLFRKSRSQFWRIRRKNKDFPKGKKINLKSIGWTKRELEAWLNA